MSLHAGKRITWAVIWKIKKYMKSSARYANIITDTELNIALTTTCTHAEHTRNLHISTSFIPIVARNAYKLSTNTCGVIIVN